VLVDLLAAREEHEDAVAADEGPNVEAPPRERISAGRLDELSADIRSRLPMLPGELGPLVAAGVATRGPSVNDLVALFREWEVPVPFRLVRRCGANLLVAPAAVGATEAALMEASHLVSQRGLCNVDDVVDRVRSLGLGPVDVRAATRALATLPRFRWLDEASGWFSIVGSEDHVAVRLRKIFTVADCVRVAELGLVLSKRADGIAWAPTRAFESYLSSIADYEVRDGWAERRASFRPTVLAPSEQAIVDGLRRNGGSLSRASLRRATHAAGVKPAALRDFLRSSPLVVSSSRSIRLVGFAPPTSSSPSASLRQAAQAS
jgi:hypothetical protein